MVSNKVAVTFLLSIVYLIVVISSASVGFKKNSGAIVKKNDVEVKTHKSTKTSETSHDKFKRSAPTYFTHWKYLHYNNRALNRAKHFVSRSGIGNDQRFMKLAKLHGLSHLIKKN